MTRSTRGAALVDVVVACAVIAIIAAIAIPSVQATRERGEARMAARYLAQRLQMARAQAIRRNRVVAMRFDPAEVGRFGIYADGDGDGVRQPDVDSAVDPVVDADARLTDHFAGVRLHVVDDVPSPDGGLLTRGSDPVRIGASSFVSFNPLGGATSGTIYLAGRSGPQMGVRILGSTGRIRVLWFDTARREWRQD